MFLKEPTLNISFRVMDEGKSFMIYASTAGFKCFECGDIGHKRTDCPHKVQVNTNEEDNVDNAVSDVNEPAGENIQIERTETVTPAIAEGHESDNEEIEVQENAALDESQSVVVQDDMDENGMSSEIASTSGVGMLNQRMESTVEGPLEDENKVEMRDEDTFSQMSGFSETGSQMEDSNLYSLQEINYFLDESFGRVVEIRDFFSDTEKFVKSVVVLQRTVGLDELNEKKRFRLRKLLTKLRKRKGSFSKK